MTFVAIPNVLITDFGLYSCLYTLHFTLYTRKIALKKRFSNIRHIILCGSVVVWKLGKGWNMLAGKPRAQDSQ